jgi:4-oxalocrotonate tautomerase
LPVILQTGVAMPFVRISLLKGRPPGLGKQIAAAVQAAMIETVNAHSETLFQVISEHDNTEMVYDASHKIPPDQGIVLIEITLTEGRIWKNKLALHKSIIDQLEKKMGLAHGSVFIALIDIRKENWSF